MEVWKAIPQTRVWQMSHENIDFFKEHPKRDWWMATFAQVKKNRGREGEREREREQIPGQGLEFAGVIIYIHILNNVFQSN